MEFNFIIVAATAFIPLLLGFVWYHEKVFGAAWAKHAGMTPEKMQSGNMPVIFGLSFILSIMLAFTLMQLSIHQFGVVQLFASHPEFATEGSAIHQQFMNLMQEYGDRHRTFGHGAVHGAIAGIFFAVPIIITNGLFERKNWKYLLINCGYWILCATLMSGVICQFA